MLVPSAVLYVPLSMGGRAGRGDGDAGGGGGGEGGSANKASIDTMCSAPVRRTRASAPTLAADSRCAATRSALAAAAPPLPSPLPPLARWGCASKASQSTSTLTCSSVSSGAPNRRSSVAMPRVLARPVRLR